MSELAELEVIEQILVEEGHGIVDEESPSWARRLDAACAQVRASLASVTDPDDDWGDLHDQVLMLEQERDEIAARAAAQQVDHANELAAIADRIIETLGATDLQIEFVEALRARAGRV